MHLKLGRCKGPIEPGIKGLIDAMNNTGYLQTICSCEGHPERDELPYVSFVCQATHINRLCKALNEAEQSAEAEGLVLAFNLSIIYDKDIINCQDSLPQGYLSLDLQFDTDEDIWESRELVFKILANSFNSNVQEPIHESNNVIPFKRPPHHEYTN